MKYLADLLTLIRFILAIVLVGFSLGGGSPENAFIVFLIAELTDAFDGVCAKKWPFANNKTPWYRKYAAKYDMISDVLLAGAQVLYLTLQINWVVGLVFIVYYLISAGGGDLLIYGKILGHPDDCTRNSLIRKNFPLAKKIILSRRLLYASCLALISMFILLATNWPETVKSGFFVLGCFLLVFMWFFLRQRRENVSRDAIEIEKKLSQNSKKP